MPSKQLIKAHELVKAYADADSSWADIYSLLTANNIPPKAAELVASIYRSKEHAELSHNCA